MVLSSIVADPLTKIDSNFTYAEQGFVVLKLKFHTLSNPINLYHQDGMYYVVIATILMHKMMVEACVKTDDNKN